MKSVLSQHRTQQKRAWMRHILFKFGIISIVGGGSILSLLLLPRFQLNTITISGNVSVPSEEIMRVVDRFLTERVGWFFPRSNIFLFRQNAFKSYILKEFPRFATANVSRSFSQELTLDVSERAPWGLYCKTVGEDCFYIAEDGVLTAEAPQLTGNAVFRITDKRFLSAFFLLGDAVLSESDAAFLQETGNLLASRFQVTAGEAILGRVFQDQTELFTNEGWYALFDERTNKERALENLVLVLDQHITDRSTLEYIDIRFEGKVFYKKK